MTITITSCGATNNITVVSGGATTTINSALFPLIKKADDNTGGASVIEIGDIVYFKDVIDANNEITTLVGHTYNGGDIELRESYSKDVILEI